MSYHPPDNLLDVLQKIEYEEALGPDDPRYVETQEARGSQKTLDRLARKFGLQLSDGRFAPRLDRHVLFFGHNGSGKTTELRHYATTLSGPNRFFVVEVNITVELDRNNLQYADTLMAMARALLAALDREHLRMEASAFEALERWFDEHVLNVDEVKEFATEVKSGAELKSELPFFLKLFTSFSAAFKANKTYKDQLRRVIRNSFGNFAVAFNRFLRSAEEVLSSQGRGQRVLFILDGTDKLRGEDTRRFFVEDVEQLLEIEALVVYTAPLSLKYEGNLAGKLDADLVLPMIKLCGPDNAVHEAGWAAMRNILLCRADRKLFAGDAEIDRLVEHSGGHPRELLRLLKLCCEFAEDNRIDANTVTAAIRQLASEYRRFLEPEDYALLVKLDNDPIHSGNDERTRKLLYNLALLEYNDGSWRRSHPVVRTLEAYQRAASAPAA